MITYDLLNVWNMRMEESNDPQIEYLLEISYLNLHLFKLIWQRFNIIFSNIFDHKNSFFFGTPHILMKQSYWNCESYI